jgi:hypothetical protein
MGTQTGPLSSPATGANLRHCTTESCNEPAVAELGTQSLCVEHFATQFMRDAQSRDACLRSEPFDPAATEAFNKLLADCAAQAKELLESGQNLASPSKERLRDVLLLTSQLHQRLRRSPRTPVSIGVWLRREDPGQTWEEEAWTSSISRHGAGLVCRHRVEPGRTLYLCRKDRGGRAKARVVYSRYDSAGDRQIGVEILDRIDFWDASELGHNATSSETKLREDDKQESKIPESKATESLPTSSAPSVGTSDTLYANVAFEVAGQTGEYEQIPVRIEAQGNEVHVSGIIPGTLSDFITDLMSLAKDAKTAKPVRVRMAWRQER